MEVLFNRNNHKGGKTVFKSKNTHQENVHAHTQKTKILIIGEMECSKKEKHMAGKHVSSKG